MIETLMRTALENRLLAVALVVVIVGVGAVSVAHLPMDAFPDVTSNQVEIVCDAPGMSPLEIEKFVTYPIESSLKGLPGLDTMRSVTKYGLSVLTLIFRDDVDIYFARQQVFERLSGVSGKLPEGVEAEMGPVATAMGEIYQYTLEGPVPSGEAERVSRLTELRTLQDWVVSPLLKSVPGVNEVNSFGGYIKQYQVVVDPDRLLKYGLALTDVHAAIRNNNQNVGGNIIDRASEQFIVRGIGLIRSDTDIGRIVVKTHHGVPVYLRDVAEIGTGVATRQGLAQKDGRSEAVGGIVMMLKGENSLQVVERVREKVAEINSGNVLPAGVKLVPFYDRSEIVGRSIETVSHALLIGALLVLAVLYIFLRSLRGAVVVVLALPLSMLLTFIVMRWAGLDANLMSLGGLAISIGMIIDATIIQVENVQRYLAQADDSRPKVQRVLRAVMEVRKPSIFGELIIALTFLPILTLQGMEGKMFTPLAYTVAIALFASLFLSIFVIPGLCGLLLKPHPEKENLVLRLVKKAYLPLLSTRLRSRLLVLGVSLAAVLGAVALIPRLGSEFMPVMDEGAFDMDIQMLPGVSLSEAAAITGQVQDRLMKFPELQHAVSKTGQTGISLEARGLDRSAFQGNFLPREKWRKGLTKEELIDRMRAALADIPGIAYSFSQPIQCRIDELVAGTRAQVIVKLFGDDLDALRHTADRLAHVLSEVPGCTDLVVEKISGQPYINIQVDREKIARYGLNVADVLGVVETAIGGKSATDIYEGNRAFDLVVRFPEERRSSVEAMGNILIQSDSSAPIPLGELADIRVAEGPVQISRENGQRRIGIELNVTGRDIGGFVAQAREHIRRELQLPPGTYITWGGQFENQRQAMDRLMIITPLVIGMILLLLFLTFHSLRQALLVVAVLPFALAGGVFALILAGMYMSVPASVGFIVLFGVAVLNSLVLVARVSQLRDEGLAPAEAVRGACENRLRPILMTASITIFSLVPLLFATGPGSEVQRPLAAVVVGGLLTSTLATLLVLPALYPWFDRRDSA